MILTAIFPRNDEIAVLPEIRAINANLARVADGNRVRVLDVNGALADKDGRLFPGIMGDGLHPTVKGYEVWAAGLKPMLTGLLGRARRNRSRASAYGRSSGGTPVAKRRRWKRQALNPNRLAGSGFQGDPGGLRT